MSPAFGSNGRSGLYKNQHIKLKNNLKYIDALLVKSELFAFNPDYPIIYPDIEVINEMLTANNIITNFKYSTGGKDLNRIIFTANHTEDDLNAVIRL
jgi:hypothetical protein